MSTLRVIGAGRAGRSLANALTSVGWEVRGLLGRGDDVTHAAQGVDVLAIATPDDVVADVAASVRPAPDTLVLHLSGSLTLEVLSPHTKVGSLHPLASLPDPEKGARALLGGGAVAIAGDALVAEIANDLGAQAFEVPDELRALYHATAVVAANHVTAVTAQVERLAEHCGVPADAFLAMTERVLTTVRDVGATAALTGPAARGDRTTIERHLEALPAAERHLYLELSDACAALAGRPLEDSRC